MLGGEIDEILAVGREVAAILIDATTESLPFFDLVTMEPPAQQQDGARRPAPEQDDRPTIARENTVDSAGGHLRVALLRR
jgi:hypothetical protein